MSQLRSALSRKEMLLLGSCAACLLGASALYLSIGSGEAPAVSERPTAAALPSPSSSFSTAPSTGWPSPEARRLSPEQIAELSHPALDAAAAYADNTAVLPDNSDSRPSIRVAPAPRVPSIVGLTQRSRISFATLRSSGSGAQAWAALSSTPGDTFPGATFSQQTTGGANRAPGGASAQTPQRAQGAEANAAHSPETFAPAEPTILGPIDTAALGLGEHHVQAIEDLREQFVKDVGGENQNPDDPKYTERWEEAVPSSEAQLRAKFGKVMANQIQLQAAQRAYEAQLAK